MKDPTNCDNLTGAEFDKERARASGWCVAILIVVFLMMTLLSMILGF